MWVTLGTSTAETVSHAKTQFWVFTPLALPLTEEGLAKSRNVTSDL